LQSPRHILVFRFSSLGDIAMTVPVIRQVLHQHTQLHITFVSIPFVAPLFKGIERLHFYGADVKGTYKGVAGLYRLYKELKATATFDGIADLHNVLRTQLLRAYFSFSHVPAKAIDKGRQEKRELTRRHHKKLRPLKSTFERYADVFAELGLLVSLTRQDGIQPAPFLDALPVRPQSEKVLIGIAPFARYTEKTYPPEQMIEVIRLLLLHPSIMVVLFGGKADANVLEQWEKDFTGVQSLAGKMSFEKELQRISRLDLMISMDSANMHLASLYGVPVISIWGGTHPWLGFYGWGQAPENAMQVALECRPSSVFGNKKCYRGDLACLNGISPVAVYDAVMRQLQADHKNI
jgi:ADP-heptose:LPS heptosyltransferase